MTIAPNTSFGRYQVLTRLGAGGMGEVYSAHDTQLERTVALKVLHAEVAVDEGRMRRFKQEAKAAAALNHPHIAHIYEIGEAEGTSFMAMELIDGETLRQKIHRANTSVNRLLEWLTQVADGLAKAHAAGIVHRDLKPDNIMISRDGYAKILDFGLAKLIEPQKAAGTEANAASEIATAILAQPLSIPGMIMGTVGYMSPEQARGQTNIDGRSDIFSFGCILYEAVTRHKPFAGETVVDSLHNIIHEQPAPIKDHNTAVPPDLQRIVRRCLAKDPEDRFQTIKDVGTELKDLRREIENIGEVDRSTAATSAGSQDTQTSDRTVSLSSGRSTSPTEAIHSTSSAEYIAGEIKRHKWSVATGALALLLIIVGISFALYKFWPKAGKPSQSMKVERLTTNGKASDAAISPDGKYVVYVLDEGGQQSLWTRQVATSSNVQIIPPGPFEYWALSFTPDSNYVNFVKKEKSILAALYQMPILGGAQKRLLSDADGAVTYSPDGARFAFVRGNYPKLGDSALIIANADGTGERTLLSRTRPETITWWRQQTPAWSSDGKSIACVLGGPGTGSGMMNIFEVQVSDGSAKPITAQGWYEIKRVAWLPDKSGLLILAADKASAFYAQQIWHISYPSGEVHRITTDFNDYLGLSLAADSTALAAVQSNRISNIWIAPSVDSAAGARQIKSGGHNQDGTDGLSWTPDGRIVFYSRAAGGDDIWIMNADGSGQKQLTVDAGTNYDFKVTPDGRYIVFTSERSGKPNIWRMDLDGGNPRQLSTGNNDFSANISPDSRWVVYGSDGGGKPALWKVSIDGGVAVEFTEYAAENPEISPDGKQIVCLYRDQSNSPWRYAVIAFEGGPPLKVFDLPIRTEADIRWTPDGRAIAYLNTVDGVTNVWSFPLDGSPPKQLTDFKSDQIYLFKWSPDGKQLVLARGTRTSDVVLLRDFR